jgi:molybdenum cofactor guanylyltransferase
VSINKVPLAAIALAGGKSSRMGTDKALLEIDKKPLLLKICEVAQACGAEPICIVTPWQERYQSLTLPKCEFISETLTHSPLTGFALGLAYLADFPLEWVLLLACDLPNLKSEVIKLWSWELINIPPQAIAYLPKTSTNLNHPWEPLCGFYRVSCLPSLQAHIQTGNYSFQTWLSQSEVIEIPDLNPQMLFNCNTPEDYELIKKSSAKKTA